MNSITMKLQADELIRLALQEDITSEDVSTNAVMPHAVKGTVDLIAKEDGVVAGLDVYARVFQILDELTEINFYCKDGDEVKAGDLMATVTGDIRVLLSGERVALNYLQRMCGIATIYKSRWQNYLKAVKLHFWIKERQHLIAVCLKNMPYVSVADATIDTICQMVAFKR